MVEGKDKKWEREYEKNTLIIFILFNGFNINGMWWIKWDDITTYTYSSELDIKNLDSSDADDGCSLKAIHAVIDGLTKTDKKGNIVNAVAKSEELSEDGLTHTYKLRKI
mgnify:FL=1